MRRWSIAGTSLLLGATVLVATAVVLADEPQPYPYVLYLPLVLSDSGDRVVFPTDNCEVSYLENAAAGNGLESYCRSADPDRFIASVSLATGYAPSPRGGQAHFLMRSYYFFGMAPASPVLNLQIEYAVWGNARQAVLEVYAFPVSWTLPFTITEPMLALRGEKLGETTVLAQPAPFTVTIPLSDFRPGQGIVVLSPCETQPELCAVPYVEKYLWGMFSYEVENVWLSRAYP